MGGCAAETNDPTLQHVLDVCESVALLPGPDAAADEVASLDSAIEMWNRLGQSSLSRADGGAALGLILEVRFESAAPFFHGVYDDESGVVFINHQLRDHHQRSVTIAHELGHAFGLLHITSRSSVMNPQNLAVEPTEEDAGDLVALWGDCGVRRP